MGLHQYSVRKMAAAVSRIRFAVAWETIGVIRTRLNRRVTCRLALPVAGLTALQEPVALAAYSPPGAFIGGFDSTTSGGLGSVTNSQAVLLGGTTLVTGPWGHGSDTGAPTSCWVTALRTVWAWPPWLAGGAVKSTPAVLS